MFGRRRAERGTVRAGWDARLGALVALGVAGLATWEATAAAPDTRGLAAGAVAALWLLAAVLLRRAVFLRIAWDAERIRHAAPPCPSRSAPWRAILGARPSWITDAALVRVRGIGTLRITPDLAGAERFLARVVSARPDLRHPGPPDWEEDGL